jgi:hypothetical protein
MVEISRLGKCELYALAMFPTSLNLVSVIPQIKRLLSQLQKLLLWLNPF